MIKIINNESDGDAGGRVKELEEIMEIVKFPVSLLGRLDENNTKSNNYSQTKPIEDEQSDKSGQKTIHKRRHALGSDRTVMSTEPNDEKIDANLFEPRFAKI